MTRIYVPTTLHDLASHLAAGEIPGSVGGHVADAEDEDSEYAALMNAARSSATLLDGPGRRVVIVAERPDQQTPSAPIPMEHVVAVHADTEDRAPDDDPDDDLAWFATQEIPDLL